MLGLINTFATSSVDMTFFTPNKVCILVFSTYVFLVYIFVWDKCIFNFHFKSRLVVMENHTHIPIVDTIGK